MAPRKYLLLIILIAFTVETLSSTWLLKFTGWVPFLSILYFLAGIAIPLLLLSFPVVKIPHPPKRHLLAHTTHYRLILIGLIALAMYSWCRYWFEEIPIDINNADMLPIIKVMGERFVAGHHKNVYDTIPWIWNGIQPIYLPAMWLPYVPAIAIGLDIRWITMAGLLFSFAVFLFLYRPEVHRYLSFITGVLAFLLFWWILADNTPGIISVSEEGVVIAYYVLLVLSLVSGNPWWIGITASLCMLSRYSLVGWIPAYTLYLLLDRKWKNIGIFALTGALCFTLLFLLPVGWQTFNRLAHLPGNYVPFAARVWKDSPDVFSSSPGLAYFFGPKRIVFLHTLLISLSFIVPSGFVLYCYRRSKRTPVANVALAALKLSLVIFYCFIDVPYLYLFYTSSFVSLLIVTMLLRTRDEIMSGSAMG
ncbi:hypothetical protein Q4E93_23355 [Flavitalea sp. BT771]|uniref:hypothetical protein n=1 Tax=Flavitalea sp. BT771 TaxID=3063329 RepID=UPI0026E11642|nr:hypothetical protein [Flavitalea sp. BT771]MDO6433568.1 hypothetical protein [Flavitalea sp. BT771]MDV6222527.1 hypothetical protein [Flavitalea sp. BT771]